MLEHSALAGSGEHWPEAERPQTQGDGGQAGQDPAGPGRLAQPRYRPQGVQEVRAVMLRSFWVGLYLIQEPILCSLIIDNIVLISRALRRQFIIPDFESFTRYIDDFYDRVRDIDSGKVKLAVQPSECDSSGPVLQLHLSRHLPIAVGDGLHPAVGQARPETLWRGTMHYRRPEILTGRHQNRLLPAVVLVSDH